MARPSFSPDLLQRGGSEAGKRGSAVLEDCPAESGQRVPTRFGLVPTDTLASCSLLA